MATIELDSVPATGPLYRRAAVGVLPGRGASGRGTLPDVELVVRGVAVDRDHLAAYDRVCGFPLRDRLPATYPHVLAFPLSLRLMAAPDFPFPLVGLVHVTNTITVRRPLDAGEPLDLRVRATDLRPHDRGRQFDVVTTAEIGGEEVWRGVATYLRRTKSAAGDRADGGRSRDQGSPSVDRPAPPGTARWRVDPGVGTAYARVSGDRNPIHTSSLGARLFGFRRPIAHGMWTKARCLAALDPRLPDAYTVAVAFRAPVTLPGTVVFSADLAGGEFTVYDARGGRIQLRGRLD
jgi:acyl dehydratase